MIKCPNCGSSKSKVVAHRPTDKNRKYRYRKCINCGTNFSTIELVVRSGNIIDDMWLLNSTDVSEVLQEHIQLAINDIKERGKIK